jgi:hypothetical protein
MVIIGSPRDLTLLGLPRELLLKIFKHIFEDWVGPCEGEFDPTMTCVDVEILQVCRLLYIEGKKALRAKLNQTGMSYHHDSPARQMDEDEIDPANDEDDDEYIKQCNVHIRFIKQYRDWFETLYIHNCPDRSPLEFSLRWFPNLKEAKFNDCRYRIKAVKDDGFLKHDELNEEAVLLRFKQLSEENEDDYGCPIFDEDIVQVLRYKKGIDRLYTVKVDLNLEIEDVGTWVSHSTSFIRC